MKASSKGSYISKQYFLLPYKAQNAAITCAVPTERRPESDFLALVSWKSWPRLENLL